MVNMITFNKYHYGNHLLGEEVAQVLINIQLINKYHNNIYLRIQFGSKEESEVEGFFVFSQQPFSHF